MNNGCRVWRVNRHVLSMTAGANTHRSTLIRIGLTAVFGPTALLIAIATAGAGSPVGFLLAIPPIYLAWVWLVDLGVLLRNTFRATDSYVARPHYGWWIASCAGPVIAWLIWASSHLHR
jgi:hypothetical protein